jgi:hypothetical protein
MPRKSVEALAGEYWRRQNLPPPPPPPAPPAWLSEASARHWREITACRPHDYWVPPNGDFLAHLCSHIAMADRIWAELHKVDLADPKQMRRYRSLSVMAGRSTRVISMLLTKLRLLPRYVPPSQPIRVSPWERHV